MQHIYLLTGPFWKGKDKRICTDAKQAINLSIQNPNSYVEVFIKWSNASTGEEIYYPTGCYYKGGKYVDNLN